MADTQTVTLHGRVIISGLIEAVTGLHIGRGREGVSIGGVDNPVMRDKLSNEPYIPGSSLKGKLRSLAEKRDGAPQNQNIGRDVRIHVAKSAAQYKKHFVNRLFGVPGETQVGVSAPTRLVVRDARLTEASRNRLRGADTDLPFTEVKYEAAIDRITAAANPRPLERVPAESQFGFEMIFSLYESGDYDLLGNLVETMRLLEDDYLGGSGSRGSGQVVFKKLKLTLKPVSAYLEESPDLTKHEADDLSVLVGQLSQIKQSLATVIPISSASSEEEAVSSEEANG